MFFKQLHCWHIENQGLFGKGLSFVFVSMMSYTVFNIILTISLRQMNLSIFSTGILIKPSIAFPPTIAKTMINKERERELMKSITYLYLFSVEQCRLWYSSRKPPSFQTMYITDWPTGLSINTFSVLGEITTARILHILGSIILMCIVCKSALSRFCCRRNVTLCTFLRYYVELTLS